MNRSNDILFTAEYIKNVLYFATVRQGKILKNTIDTQYFCIDNELVYENYYSDFGPLNLGCVYKYCRILNEKLKQFLNKQVIVHYTSIEPRKKTNSAFLLGCYGVLYLSLSPRDALKPLMVHGQSYRAFQDATQGESSYTISLMDCLQAIKKAQVLGFFNFQDFNYEEYDRLDKIQGGDLNWIVPGKFLAFIGPVDYSVSLFHPPEMYINYFMENNIKIVIRLNKRLYDGNVFNNVGIIHYDLFFPDGSCPPRHILFKFLQISEEASCALAVHCKAGLGRTGSLIGCYLMKHYRMTAHEAIGWMRICRPGSVIGHQQGWLEQLEPWLIKQGNIYRKRTYQDTEKMPLHEYGIYSIAEKTLKQRPVVFQKSPPPPPPLHRHVRSDAPPIKQQNSRMKEDYKNKSDLEENEATMDRTVTPTTPISASNSIHVTRVSFLTADHDDCESEDDTCCGTCFENIYECLWMSVAVRCVRSAPNYCDAFNTATEKECDWRVKSFGLHNTSQNTLHSGDQNTETLSTASRRSNCAGDPRAGRPSSRTTTPRSQTPREQPSKNLRSYTPITTYRTSQPPVIKNVNDARNYLLWSSMYNSEREKQLNSSVTITPRSRVRQQSPPFLSSSVDNRSYATPSDRSKLHSSVPTTMAPVGPQTRRRNLIKERLGRSPSPPPRTCNEQSRATNTPLPSETIKKDASKTALKDVLSRLRLSMGRDGSCGAASLGAPREAPAPRRAPSVRSDERPLATQGDMLNSIKLQRRRRDTMNLEKTGGLNDRVGMAPNKLNHINNVICKTNNNYPKLNQESCLNRDRQSPISRSFNNQARPKSPTGRRNAQSNSLY